MKTVKLPTFFKPIKLKIFMITTIDIAIDSSM